MHRPKAQCLLLRARVLSSLRGADATDIADAYRMAIEAYEKMRSEPNVCVVQAAFADHLRQRGELAPAKRLVDGVMAHLEHGMSLAGTGDGELARLQCQRVLAAAEDVRAAPLLASLQEEMSAIVARFADIAMRERFLDAAPWRREILATRRAGQCLSMG